MDAPFTTDDLASAVRAAVGRPDAEVGVGADVEVGVWEVRPVEHHVDNMTTARLDRVVGTLADGTPWSLFAKTLRPASASPVWAFIPDFARELVLRQLDWRDEPRAYACGLAEGMPTGIRLPALWHLDEGDDRIVLWLEDVADVAVWDVPTYRRAAEALGRMAGAWPEARVTAELGLRRRLLGEYYEGPVVHAVLPALADDATWADPLVEAATADDPALREDLDRLAARAPGLVERVHAGPQALGHGDATPANVLDDGADLVLVDWSYGASMAVGMDLAQLVAGAVDGRRTAEVGPVLAAEAVVVDAYCAGVAAEGGTVDRAAVELAHLTTLAVRSGLGALDLGHAADLPDEQRAALLRQRTALARHALDRLATIAP
jgi:hypothetical protein